MMMLLPDGGLRGARVLAAARSRSRRLAARGVRAVLGARLRARRAPRAARRQRVCTHRAHALSAQTV